MVETFLSDIIDRMPHDPITNKIQLLFNYPCFGDDDNDADAEPDSWSQTISGDDADPIDTSPIHIDCTLCESNANCNSQGHNYQFILDRGNGKWNMGWNMLRDQYGATRCTTWGGYRIIRQGEASSHVPIGPMCNDCVLHLKVLINRYISTLVITTDDIMRFNIEAYHTSERRAIHSCAVVLDSESNEEYHNDIFLNTLFHTRNLIDIIMHYANPMMML